MVGFLFLFLLVASVQSHYVSVSEIQNLVKLEQMLVHNFRDYANELKEKLRIVSSALEDYKEHDNDVEKQTDLYVSNQLNAFRLKRRLHQDWQKWQLYMEQQVGIDKIELQQRLLTRVPKKTEYKQAAESLQATFTFYNYAVNSFLLGNSSHLRLSPVDCYHMGVLLFEQQKYHEALEWLTAAAANYTTSPYNDVLDVPLWRVYEHLSQVYIKLNMQEEAVETVRLAIDVAPLNDQLLELISSLGSLPHDEDPLPAPAAIVSDLQQLCRAKSEYDTELSCKLNEVVTPFLILAPLRLVEILYDPYVMVYKDVIYEREIWNIKDAYKRCPSTAKSEADVGIQSCLIPDNYSPMTQQLAVRIQDMTGLNNPMKGLYVLEYGPRDPFKIFELSTFDSVHFDEIEATAIIFLNNVELGGAFTLPSHEISIFPHRGDALVSFNEGEFEHTVCPNVVGSSLVIVKFLLMEDLPDS